MLLGGYERRPNSPGGNMPAEPAFGDPVADQYSIEPTLILNGKRFGISPSSIYFGNK